ncbi:Asp-tRNA(Asn)/Glu-tRNA(Gln) amidotransferase subunit GatC [Pseudenhygromyxa sp. WMMC2535]|uniref:Asp-tRNA(Asn)/Glu-tRNA(Gln) amidotransferase subunit GatC n=1 Tax=Pseudenhygromyxa sp. WMMC2535 TaxID=2712867 RepID=UPI001555F891|nr:Asp-tRNA(Asn)/Glu-tRNA(Gln) amidotransferase subunit GatC [Pseudenhygromyxa sp. WMMC2535]NVB39139.1 Asp-tRNA(Asn)/Glu-tRNA(Gln) amidotransferase subunit GatC [Pseudenhygromyxa sp. WMMC2535]
MSTPSDGDQGKFVTEAGAFVPSRALAALARLALDEEESRALDAQLRQILTYLQGLRAVDVEGVPEYLSAEQPDSALRDDEVGPMLSLEQAVAGAPAVREGSLLVPKFKD